MKATQKPRGGSADRARRTLVPGTGNRAGLPVAPPVGMADLVQPESIDRRALGERLVTTFSRYGYDLVATPFFEHADVLERGLEQVDRRDLLRFVEPETGEVALLRPDITPQIARIIATRLHDRPPPWRLCYEGHVIRRRRGRARMQRQIAQTGVEHVGGAGPEADVEVIALAAHACEAVGLADLSVELGQVRIGRAALEPVPEAARQPVADALVHKDVSALESLLRTAGVKSADRKVLVSLADLYGDLDVLARARRLLRGTAAESALHDLEEVATRLADRGLGPKLQLDLGEVRGQAYYTGVSFTILAEGPGQPVGIGGRYDNLLGRFGMEAPATGFALDLGNLTWALERADRPFRARMPLRLALAGDELGALAPGLRRRGVTVAELGSRAQADALAFARAWGYDAVLAQAKGAIRASRLEDGATRAVDPTTEGQIEALIAWAKPGAMNASED